MDSLIPWIIGFTALGGVLSVFAAAAFLLVPEETRARMLSPMVSFAIGALLGASFLAILPHAFETPGVGAHQVTLTVLCGILVFFLLEKMVIWRHCHTHDCDVHGGVPDVDRAMKAAGRTYQHAIYPGTGHGFLRTRNVAAQADKAWGDIFAFLGETIGK